MNTEHHGGVESDIFVGRVGKNRVTRSLSMRGQQRDLISLLYFFQNRGKGKFIPVLVKRYAMRRMGKWRYIFNFLDLGTRWR
jgi:hypothetical protein